MRQLGELKSKADTFKQQGVEVIAVFREEKKGEEGLAAIKERSGVDFTLCLDLGAEKTRPYSPGKMQFANYVVDASGVIRGVIDGDLKNRAKSAELLSALDRISVERAVLDYVEGIYEVKPEWIKRSVHPDLKKLGFWRPDGEEPFKPGASMTFDQLHDLAAKYNKDGKIPDDAPKTVEVFDVMDKIATAKLTADWGTDYFQLVKEDGKWMILHVVWQSPPKS